MPTPTSSSSSPPAARVISMTAAVVPERRTPIYPAMRQRLDAILANHATLYRAGARIVCSSDAGVGPNKPHHVLPYGVSNFLPSIGMTNAEAITTSPPSPPRCAASPRRTGTLEAGKDADILAVAGNPLDDITAIHNVIATYTKGKRPSQPN